MRYETVTIGPAGPADGSVPDPRRPCGGAGGHGPGVHSHGKDHRAGAVRGQRAPAAGAGQRDKGDDHAAGDGGHRLRGPGLRRRGHSLRLRLLHGRQPDLAEGERAADGGGYAQGGVRGVGQRLQRSPGGAPGGQRGGLRGADEPAGKGAGYGGHPL